MAAKDIEKHQFKKGESGNPNGRKKGSKNMKTILRELLEVKNGERSVIVGDEQIITVGQQIIETWITKAIADGDWRAAQAIFEQMHGKPEQKNTVNAAVATQSVEISKEDYKAQKAALEEEV